MICRYSDCNFPFTYRCKEFIMKDLYTFDETEEKAIETYHAVCKAYDKIFDTMGVPYMKGKWAAVK